MTTDDHRWPQMTIDHCHSLFQGLLLQSHGCVWICRMLFLEISAAFSQRSKHVHTVLPARHVTRLQAPAWILRPQGCILEIRWLEMDQHRSQRNLSDNRWWSLFLINLWIFIVMIVMVFLAAQGAPQLHPARALSTWTDVARCGRGQPELAQQSLGFRLVRHK